MTEGMTMTVKARALAALKEAKHAVLYEDPKSGQTYIPNDLMYERASIKSGIPIEMLKWAEEDENK